MSDDGAPLPTDPEISEVLSRLSLSQLERAVAQRRHNGSTASADVVPTLEALIIALGGKGTVGALQLNVLEPVAEPVTVQSPDSVHATFRGRARELKQLAEHVGSIIISASGKKAQDHPFLVATAFPGTGKTTFAAECLSRLPEQPELDEKTREILRSGKTICLNLNGGQATWIGAADQELSAEARLVARICSVAFLGKSYQDTWTQSATRITANKDLLTFKNIIPLIATAIRLAHAKPPGAKVSLLLNLDEFQHLGDDLKVAMRPLLTSMGDSGGARCMDEHNILVLPFLTGLSLDLPMQVVDISGHEQLPITLLPLSAADAYAIVVDFLLQLGMRELQEYFSAALDDQNDFQDLETRQLNFRGMILDCGGNPDLLKYLVLNMADYCRNGFHRDNLFLDGLFTSFNKSSSIWQIRTRFLFEKIQALPTSLVPIVVASIPINVKAKAVDNDGREMTETWAQVFSKCGLSPKPHPTLKGYSLVEMPYVFLNVLVQRVGEIRLESVVDFPYLYRSGQAFENLVFKIHAQRTFYLLGKSPLRLPSAALFKDLFPGAFLPVSLADCKVHLPPRTIGKEEPVYDTEEPWCYAKVKRKLLPNRPARVDDLPRAAADLERLLSGDVFNTTDMNHPHFDGRSALQVQLSASNQRRTDVLLLWQTKFSQPKSTTTFEPADIKKWHQEARTMLKDKWNGVKVVFVLILHTNVTSATTEGGAANTLQQVREYAAQSGDLVIVTREHMHEYLAGIAHRLYVPLESAMTVNT